MVKDGKGATILIENKIGAGDQDNQMKRYREFDPKANLFYLTLERFAFLSESARVSPARSATSSCAIPIRSCGGSSAGCDSSAESSKARTGY